jgi:nucleoside phosphorylase
MSDDVRTQLDAARDYRGFVTLARRDGSTVVGFVYERSPTHVELFDESCQHRVRVPVADVIDVAFTGDDCAADAQLRWERHRVPEPLDTPAVLVLVALRRELAVAARVLRAPVRGEAARGRLGQLRAVARAVGIGGGGAARAIAEERPRLVLALGFAGGLDPMLAAGDVVLATTVCDEVGDVYAPEPRELGAARAALAPVAEGELVCTTEVAASIADKRALAAPGRRAADLESGPIARAALRAGVPWIAVRAIVDPQGVSLPAFTQHVRDDVLGSALRHAARGPHAIAELIRLARDAHRADRALADALRRLARSPLVAAMEPERTT